MYNCIKVLEGKTIIKVEGLVVNNEEVMFHLNDGTSVIMYHQQSCCEEVWLEDICGDVEDLLGLVIHAEERCEDASDDSKYDSGTYTFYDIQTNKGCVNLRWGGYSNGYYSEGVDIKVIK